MRHSTDLSGVEWEIFVEWEGRKPLHHAFRRLRAHREAKAQKRSESNGDNLLNGCDQLGGATDELLVLAILAMVILLLVLFGPWFLAVVFGIIELGVILIAVFFGLVGRTLFRRPWRVAAVSEAGDVWAWRQTGFRKARKLVHEVAAGLSAGSAPLTLATDRLESTTAYQLGPEPDLGSMIKPELRLAAIAVVLVALAITVFVVIQRVS